MIQLARRMDRLPDLELQTSIVGVSEAILNAVATARRFANTDLPILIVGETGTGKELFAKEIHRWSGRCGELVDVNCGALPRDLIEAELFGHRRGAFTGAASDSGGLIAQANKGTLFLDELSSLPLDGQVKLLRVLETKEVRRVGDTVKRQVDFRLVGAVQQSLDQDVRAGRFRLDLFQRLAGVVIRLPPLSRRREDILPLAEHFATLNNSRLGSGTGHVLDHYDWPGNARELKAVIDRAAVISERGVVDQEDLIEALSLGSASCEESSWEGCELDSPTERMRVLRAAERNDWNWKRLAADLNMSRSHLYRKLGKLGISLSLLARAQDSRNSQHSRGGMGTEGNIPVVARR
jgi:transcriptional regulator with PAS, ATPase and Fis domain